MQWARQIIASALRKSVFASSKFLGTIQSLWEMTFQPVTSPTQPTERTTKLRLHTIDSLVCSALILLFASFYSCPLLPSPLIPVATWDIRNENVLRHFPFYYLFVGEMSLIFGHFSYFLVASIFSHRKTNERIFQRNHKPYRNIGYSLPNEHRKFYSFHRSSLFGFFSPIDL